MDSNNKALKKKQVILKKNPVNFEEAFNRLTKIVENMQSDDLSLEDTINSYKEGTELSKHCQSLLKEAKLEVENIVKTNKDS